MPLVLASASPRRQELLRDAGIEFTVKAANIPEIRRASESPKGFAERMAKQKARAVSDSLGQSHTLKVANAEPNAVLAADTIVVVLDEVLGKPADTKDAARMLRLLSGREHSVITGVCLRGEDFEDVRSETTAVFFRTISDEEITGYIESGEPMDKAGAYAIQRGAAKWVSKIEGDYNNVVGLPVDLVRQMLREHGLA